MEQCWHNIAGQCYADNTLPLFRERALLAKNNRKLEKKYKESVLQVEEERRHADQYKEQVG